MRSAIAHLYEVGQRHVGDRVGVWLALMLILINGARNVCGVSLKCIDKRFAIFKAGVGALTKEWNNGVRRVAKGDLKRLAAATGGPRSRSSSGSGATFVSPNTAKSWW
jgi:hypothetical protein